MNQYYVYIMTNKSRTLYIGVTNNLRKRVFEHKHHLVKGFTNKYNITKLIYYEITNDIVLKLVTIFQRVFIIKSKLSVDIFSL